MPFQVTQRIEDEVAIFDLAGSLTLGPQLGALRECVRQTLGSQKVSGVILRMADLVTADSSGLGELTVVYSLTAKRGFPVRLVEVNPTLQKMLELTRLDVLLPTASDIAVAKAEMKTLSA